MDLTEKDPDLKADLDTEVENMFQQYYSSGLRKDQPFVRLESEDPLINSHPS